MSTCGLFSRMCPIGAIRSGVVMPLSDVEWGDREGAGSDCRREGAGWQSRHCSPTMDVMMVRIAGVSSVALGMRVAPERVPCRFGCPNAIGRGRAPLVPAS